MTNIHADILGAAYVRGYAERIGTSVLPERVREKRLDELTDVELAQLYAIGKKEGLKMYRFKSHENLPRVHKVLGFLRSIWPENLLDVGSGRGVFLFPFLRAFPATPVTSVDLLEHIPDVQGAVCSAVRLAKRYVVVTVPSRPDDNPEHIHLLTKECLTELFGNTGCTRLQFDAVPDHLFMVATVK